MIKAKMWSGSSLQGLWDVTVKLDGVRVLFTEEGPVSRKGKPLYNIPTDHNLTDAEVFLGSFKDTISAVRSKSVKLVNLDNLYSLDPIDERLVLAKGIELTEDKIKAYFESVKDTAEGLVLRQDSVWLKVKPEETFDVTITGIQPGEGKHKGKLGAFLTPMGKVGTGFTDSERELFNDVCLIGETIEVSCMSLTDTGMFRHPRFVRVRFDK
jgi:hypothetical protein